MALAKYAETEPWRASRGRQRSFREQLRQALVGPHFGGVMPLGKLVHFRGALTDNSRSAGEKVTGCAARGSL